MTSHGSTEFSPGTTHFVSKVGGRGSRALILTWGGCQVCVSSRCFLGGNSGTFVAGTLCIHYLLYPGTLQENRRKDLYIKEHNCGF